MDGPGRLCWDAGFEVLSSDDDSSNKSSSGISELPAKLPGSTFGKIIGSGTFFVG